MTTHLPSGRGCRPHKNRYETLNKIHQMSFFNLALGSDWIFGLGDIVVLNSFKLRAIFLFVLFAFVTASKVHATPEKEFLQRDGELISKLYDRGDCDGVWAVIWPWIKRGNPDILEGMAESMVWGGVEPAGLKRDFLSRWRAVIIFSLYGVQAADDSSVAAANEILKGTYGMEPISECLGKERDPAVCAKLAAAEGLIPSLSDFIKELELLSSAPGAKPFCSPRHHERPKVRSEQPLPQ